MADQTTASEAHDVGSGERAERSPPASAEARRAPRLAIALYCLLALSAAVALVGRSSHFLPEVARIAAPIAFAAFFVLFAIYRFALVRARRYAPAKAFFQIGIGALFLLMLAPGVMHQRAAGAALQPLAQMLRHADPSVRALACDAFSQLSAAEAAAALPALQDLLGDPHPAVRARAQRAIERFDLQARSGAPGPAQGRAPSVPAREPPQP